MKEENIGVLSAGERFGFKGFEWIVLDNNVDGGVLAIIEFASDNILKKFYFKDPSLYARNSQYAAFLKQVTTYTRSGKVPHDDAPDSLALLENELRGLIGNTVEIMDRRV